MLISNTEGIEGIHVCWLFVRIKSDGYIGYIIHVCWLYRLLAISSAGHTDCGLHRLLKEKPIGWLYPPIRRVAAPTFGGEGNQGHGNIGIGVEGDPTDHTSRTGTTRAHNQEVSHVSFHTF